MNDELIEEEKVFEKNIKKNVKANNEEEMRKVMMFGVGGFLGKGAEFGRDRSLTYKV